MLSFSVFFSIFVACFLSICMFQLSSNVKSSIEEAMNAKKGLFDLQIKKEENRSFQPKEIEELQRDKEVKQISGGYRTGELSDTYMVGVKDDVINRSLYKYTRKLKKDQIIINDALERRENKAEGDTYTIAGREFKIIEVIQTSSMSDYKMPMVIMDLPQLHELLGHKNITQVNYLLLQCADAAYENVEYNGGIVNRLQTQHMDFCISDQRDGSDYNTMLKTVQIIFRVFFAVILLVSGLFVIHIFFEYMRKYKKDMAVICTIGGKQSQVEAIFCSMSVLLSAAACLTAALFSALVSGITLNWFNAKVQLFEGTFRLHWMALWLITGVVFLAFNFAVYVVFDFSQNVLPIQVFKDTASGLRKSKKANRFLALRKIFGTEGYIGGKFMALKFKQNAMLILIIGLICALFYIGETSLQLLMANDTWYNYHSMQGKKGTGEIWSDKPMSLAYIREWYKRLQPAMGDGFMTFGSFYTDSDEETEPIRASFQVSDLTGLPQVLKMQVWKNYQRVPKTKRIVMEKTVAERRGCKLGDTVTLNSEYLGGQKDFVLVEIVDAKNLDYYTGSMIVDWDNLYKKKYKTEESVGNSVRIWLNGDKEQIREKFWQLQLEPEIELNWKMYEDVVQQSEHICVQWTTTLHIVLGLLLGVTGIGLLNAAKGMLLVRKKEYHVLRILGATGRKVRRICWMQVWSYMLSGVVLGAILGMAVVAWLWEKNVLTDVKITIEWQYILGIAIYLWGLSLLLYPTIRKIE